MMIARRGFLTDHDETWTESFRAQVDLAYQQALTCYAEACLAIGGTEVPGAERAARRLIDLSPLSGIGYQLLMEVLATRGDTAAALVVYDPLRHTLRNALGVDPGPAAQRLHHAYSTRALEDEQTCPSTEPKTRRVRATNEQPVPCAAQAQAPIRRRAPRHTAPCALCR
jgi:DNA-binding SARP family transcriptional activator